MKTLELITALKKLGVTVNVMHVAVGNIYQCQQLRGYDWMYEDQFIELAKEYLTKE